MTAQPQTPQSDKLAAHAEQRSTITDFLEWLSSQQVLPHVWTTGLTDIRTCGYEDLMGLKECPGPGCDKCDGTGYVEISISDRYLPDRRSHDQLAMGYLGIDPVALETERRAMLKSLQNGA